VGSDTKSAGSNWSFLWEKPVKLSFRDEKDFQGNREGKPGAQAEVIFEPAVPKGQEKGATSNGVDQLRSASSGAGREGRNLPREKRGKLLVEEEVNTEDGVGDR